tara:strand:+ start:578 stop:1549 length:972 start_codon:yes stop_codon:yes gene_type:complete
MEAEYSDELFYVVISVDLDNDFIESPRESEDATALRWDGIKKGVPEIIDKLLVATERMGAPIRFTWFFRSDSQIQVLYDSHTYLLDKYSDLWNGRWEIDEFAWHPHLYRIESGRWVQETRPEELIEDLCKSHQSLSKRLGKIYSSRIGECYHSNDIMKTLDELNIQFDSTALPGRVRNDQLKQIDWEGTPDYFYHPSKYDYRVPNDVDEHFRLIEVPMSMLTIKAPYDKTPLRRYANLSFHPKLLREDLEKFVAENRYMISIIHPFEILPSISEQSGFSPHPLISYSVSDLVENIKNIYGFCEQYKKQLKFIRLCDILQIGRV